MLASMQARGTALHLSRLDAAPLQQKSSPISVKQGAAARYLRAGGQAYGAADRQAPELRGRSRPPDRRSLMLRVLCVLCVLRKLCVLLTMLLLLLLRVLPQLRGGVGGVPHRCLAAQGAGQRPPRLGDGDDGLLASARQWPALNTRRAVKLIHSAVCARRAAESSRFG